MRVHHRCFPHECTPGTVACREQRINWEPDHIKHRRFGEWLDHIKTRRFLRDRYWGAPLPIRQKPTAHFLSFGGYMRKYKNLRGGIL